MTLPPQSTYLYVRRMCSRFLGVADEVRRKKKEELTAHTHTHTTKRKGPRPLSTSPGKGHRSNVSLLNSPPDTYTVSRTLSPTNACSSEAVSFHHSSERVLKTGLPVPASSKPLPIIQSSKREGMRAKTPPLLKRADRVFAETLEKELRLRVSGRQGAGKGG